MLTYCGNHFTIVNHTQCYAILLKCIVIYVSYISIRLKKKRMLQRMGSENCKQIYIMNAQI